MPELNETQAKDLLDKALKLSRAEACEINLFGNGGGNIRYSRNTVNTAGANRSSSDSKPRRTRDRLAERFFKLFMVPRL